MMLTPPSNPTESLSPEPPKGEFGRRTFPCRSCGADLEFHIGQQQLKCPFCGFEKELATTEGAEVRENDLEAMLAAVRARRIRQSEEVESGVKEVQCGECGANVQFVGSYTSRDCAYCGSPIQLTGVHDAETRVPVDGILPFKIEKSQARNNLDRWLSSRWFLPGDLKQQGIDARFQGVYMPFWTFDAMTATRYTGRRGDHYEVRVGSGDNEKVEQRTRWTPVSGSFQHFFDDELVLATKDFPEKIIDRLQPWPLPEVVPWNQELLAGYYARTYDIELDPGFQQGKNRITTVIESMVKRRIGGDQQRIDTLHTEWAALTYKHLLLPLYLLAFKYAGKQYQVVVNAASGEVQGERPWSRRKLALAGLVIAAVIGAGYFFFKSNA